jgi:hypothetical protein
MHNYKMKFIFQYLTINHLSFSWRIRKPTKRKRKRIRRQKRRESTPPISQTTIMELPGHILIEILSKLPLDPILVSRCICTTWRFLSQTLVSPLFTSQNLSSFSAPIPLLMSPQLFTGLTPLPPFSIPLLLLQFAAASLTSIPKFISHFHKLVLVV